tara:strand:+ start:775 stop:1218 length:444 start_codon:yes stop_codon:yes gene_type:complete
MPVTFTNNIENILKKLRSILRTEFSIPVYYGYKFLQDNQYIRIMPLDTELLEYATFAETKQYNFNIEFYFLSKHENENEFGIMLRNISRLEALIHDNITMTLGDANSTTAYDCRIDNTEYDADIDGVSDDYFVVLSSFNCKHIGNVG